MIVLLILILLQELLQLPEPTLLAEWQGDTLVIIASPGSLYLVGGSLEEQYIGQDHVTLPAYGVSNQYTPIGRTAIELRNSDGLVVAMLPVPPLPQVPDDRRRVLLPIVVRPASPTWSLYFPLMAKQQNP